MLQFHRIIFTVNTNNNFPIEKPAPIPYDYPDDSPTGSNRKRDFLLPQIDLCQSMEPPANNCLWDDENDVTKSDHDDLLQMIIEQQQINI